MSNTIPYLDSKEVLENEENKNIVIDFTATWCGPCKMISPHFETLSKEERFKHIKFYKVDVDQSQELCEQFEVSCMPTFIFLKDKIKVDILQGANLKELESKLENNFLVINEKNENNKEKE